MARGRPPRVVNVSGEAASAAAQEEQNNGMMTDHFKGTKARRKRSSSALSCGQRSTHTGHEKERADAVLKKTEAQK